MLEHFNSITMIVFGKYLCKIVKTIVFLCQKLKNFDMKFTKDEAYKELVAKLTSKGEKLNLSERSINEHLDTLMPLFADEETEMSDFIEKVLPVFKVSDSNIRHDVSVGIADFKKSYTPDVKKGDKKEPEAKEDKFAELLEKINALEAANKANEAKDKIRVLRKDFISKAKEKGVKDEDWLSGYIDEIGLNEDFDVDARVESCLKLYNKSRSTINPDVTPKGGGGNTESKYIKDIIAKASAMAKAEQGE